jgi:hypothetical protein
MTYSAAYYWYGSHWLGPAPLGLASFGVEQRP